MEEEFLALLHNSDLARITDKLPGLLRHTISMKTWQVDDEIEIPVGSSKIGGLPDLPSTILWPEWEDEPLPFLAQLCLEDIASYDYGNELPHSGMLYFFFNDRALETYPPTRASWQVIYYDGDLSHLERKPFLDEEQTAYPACAVEFASRLTLPPFESLYIERLGLSYDAFQPGAPIEQRKEADVYRKLDQHLDALYGSVAPHHQLLGHPYQIQGDLLKECQQDTQYEGDPIDWQLLLQIDTDDEAGMIWGDVGVLYFYIPRQALAQRDFSQVHVIMQCT